MIELEAEQMKLVEEKKAYARKHVKVVDDDQVVRICVDNEFDSDKIDKALNKFKTERKYAGLEQFEWQDVQTKEDKREAAKQQHAAEERRRLARERRIQHEAEKAERKARTLEMQ